MGGWGERRELGIRSWGLGKRGWGDGGMGGKKENQLLFSIPTCNTATGCESYETRNFALLSPLSTQHSALSTQHSAL
uniref:Uncharacterized protein n=1 Tax=Desertifilum tharense IPPAS B-1220 TaxID=1781255 RepID=A0ACD5GYL7_9CYAN